MYSLGFMLNVFNDRDNITKYAERINYIAAILGSMTMLTCVILPAEKIFKAFLTFMSCSVKHQYCYSTSFGLCLYLAGKRRNT